MKYNPAVTADHDDVPSGPEMAAERPAQLDRDSRRHRAIEALAAGCSPREAATRAGVTERSVRRYKSDPAVAKEIDTIRLERHEQTMGLIADLAPLAARTMRDVMTDGERDSDRVRAATNILKLSIDHQALQPLADRLAASETRTIDLQQQLDDITSGTT